MERPVRTGTGSPRLWYAIFASLAVFACIAAPGAIAKPATQTQRASRRTSTHSSRPGPQGRSCSFATGVGRRASQAELRTSPHRERSTQGDHYRIASLTKTYVAAVVLQLVSEGKLRLTDSVERWLPGLVPNGKKITIRMLLIHTSGLYDHERDPEVLAPYLGGDLSYYWSPTQVGQAGGLTPAALRPGRHQGLVLLEHELRRSRPGRLCGHRTFDRGRAEAADLQAAASHPDHVPDEQDAAARVVRAWLPHARTAHLERPLGVQPLALRRSGRDRLHRRRRRRLLSRPPLRTRC